MKPLFIFILLVICIISINIPRCLCEDDWRYTNCNSPFRCGSFSDLKYPFWGENRDPFCGVTELELKCEGNVPKITVNSVNSIKYRILDWDNTTQKLTLARDDYWGSVCVGSDYKNSTFDNIHFQYDDSLLQNVTLYYRCPSSAFTPSNTPFSIDCGGSDRVYYTLGDPIPGSPCQVVVIPIFKSNASLVSSNSLNTLSEALNNGFALEWTENSEECKTCIDSGGECGVDRGFKCFCKDGPHTTSCFAGTGMLASSSLTLFIFISSLVTNA
ncbi:hypothetical protein VNO77_21659 [Canavalia gladiata]|uniref:Wall-associated receptor kinase C-terminal domain-containing protein n=1 Tax=Canavalia gladiata TaxID=3824 RepID=A0AAN9QNN7_CANGL